MIANKKLFFGGFAMLAGFCGVFLAMFLPIFEGKNLLDYMDSLYNSISKGSAYFIPKLQEEAKEFEGNPVSLKLALGKEDTARGAAVILKKRGIKVSTQGTDLEIEGDLGGILGAALADSDEMFTNEGDKLKARYGLEPKMALFFWWQALKAMDKDLKRLTKFPEAKFVGTLTKKAVECSYNYYGVKPEKIMDKILIVIFSLVFYVVYTMWYGFAIMFMFEGWGLKLAH